MLRNILAIISGAVTGIIVTLVSRIFILNQFPFPSDLDWELLADQNAYISSIPDYGLWLYIATHTVGAFLAALITSLISRKSRKLTGFIAALIVIGILLYFVLKLTFPEWFLWADITLTFLFAYLGSHIGGRRTV